MRMIGVQKRKEPLSPTRFMYEIYELNACSCGNHICKSLYYASSDKEDTKKNLLKLFDTLG